jgi:tetratricopeptide (TPR) repeat protein
MKIIRIYLESQQGDRRRILLLAQVTSYILSQVGYQPGLAVVKRLGSRKGTTMDNLRSVVANLVGAAVSDLGSPEETGMYAHRLVAASAQVDEAARNWALQHLARVVVKAELTRAAMVAMACGGLVEQGADAHVALDPVVTRLMEALRNAPSGERGETEDTGTGRIPGAAESEVSPDLEVAASTIDNLCLAAIAMLSRSAAARRAARANEALLGLLREPATSGAVFLYDLLRALDDEELLVLHPGLWRGYRVRVGGVADNFQLHTLLADALIGDPGEGWLPGVRPDRRVVAAARDQPLDPDASTARGVFNLVSWHGLQANGRISPEYQHWIWGEGSPDEIPPFEGVRVILLEPPPYVRAWNASRKFTGMQAYLTVVEVLDAEAVRSWLERMASARAGQKVQIYQRPAHLAYNWGVARLEAGDAEGAAADLSEAIRLNPDHVEAYHRRGVARSRLGDYAGAIADYSQAIALMPRLDQLSTLHVDRGVARSRLGDVEGALADYNEAIRLNPNYALAYNNWGHVLHQLGKRREAIACYDEAIRLDPRFGLAYTNRGVARSKTGDPEGAMADHNRAIELNPDLASAYINRGLLRRDQGDLEGAIADYTQAIRLDPNLANAHNNRAVARLRQGDYAGAMADYEQAIRLSPEDATLYYNRGNARSDKGDLEGAVADYDAAIRIDPQYAKAYCNRGNARSNLGDYQGALADYEASLRLKPDDATVYDNRGTVRGRLGDSDGALADFNQAIRLDPGLANAHLNRGVERQKRGDHRGAAADYEEAIRLNPRSVLAYSNRASVRCELGDYAGAIADCDRALAMNPTYAAAYNNRGFARYKKGDFELAIADCNEAIRLRPHAYFYNTRGRARAGTGDYTGAIEDFRQALSLMPDHPEAQEMRAKMGEWAEKARRGSG